jgi:dCMP deaminase
MTRPTKDEWAMELAEVTAKRATCPRRQVGAVILDSRGYVLSTGYNGLPAGFPHCIDKPCAGASCPSGTGLDLCQSLHAEQNAIARLREPFEAESMYVTTAPCVSCTKLALATSVKRMVFKSDYPSSGKDLWQAAGREWVQL